MISSNLSSDKRSTFIIVTEKEKLNEHLLSSLDACDFTDNFSVETDQGTFYITILSTLEVNHSILSKHLYESFDLGEEFGRCLVIEWLSSERTFEVYGVHKRIGEGVHYGVASSYPLSDKHLFIDTLKDSSVYRNEIEVSSWFFRASLFYTDTSEIVLNKFRKRDYWKYF